MSRSSDNAILLMWTGFTLMILTVLIAGGLMIMSIINEQYLWLIPISAYLYWIVQRAESLIERWTRWAIGQSQRQ